jgi:type II secretory pathway pseudopilin PulG
MSDKVVLPRLDLPGQKTHWAVVGVIGGGVLVLLLAAIFLVVVHSKREAESRAIETRAKEAAARVEKLRLDAAAAERAKTAAAAAERTKSAGPVAASDDANKGGTAALPPADGDSGKAGQKKKTHKAGHKGTTRATVSKGGGEPTESTKKTDASLDALLRGLK